jgi:transcriptional regulator with XRE-family HTH domain
MSEASPIGEVLRNLREQRGLSALAVSKRAGLGVNYVRQLERGGKRPDPKNLAAIAHVLQLDSTMAGKLYCLAGIHPAATPEAQKARRDSWQPLTFILVNHVLLPRLALDDTLRRRRLSESDRELIRCATAASDLAAFVTEIEGGSSPGRGLARLLEETFGQVVPETLDYINGEVKNAVGCRWPSDARPPRPYRWNERSAIASTLLSYNRPHVP